MSILLNQFKIHSEKQGKTKEAQLVEGAWG